MPKKEKKAAGGTSKPSSSSRFVSDSKPLFNFPSQAQSRLEIDDRFSIVKNSSALTKSKTDEYGRKINVDHKKRALERLYKLQDDKEEPEVDDDEVVQKELENADKKYDPARHGGFESSSDEDDDGDDSDSSSDESEDEEEDAKQELPASASMQRIQDEASGVEMGEVTNRIAIVNLDWDHIKAVDLLSVFSSFAPTGGKIERVSIFPSEFGRERMQREELEGPPKELFKKGKKLKEASNEEEESKKLLQEGDDQDFDHAALRTYQLDRLRYYYAVMVISDKTTAKSIYDATDGREYLSSSNFIDLRFVPDDTEFDDEPADECDNIPQNYKPVEFVTQALQHSKVQLTWDMHPEEAARKDSIKRAFTGGRDSLLENDLNAYLASDSEENDDEENVGTLDAEEQETPLSKKELARRKLREKLGLADEPTGKDDKSGPVGSMTVTFGSSLIPEEERKKEPLQETTIEKYKRKERERRERRQAERQAKEEANAAKPEAQEEDLSDSDVESDVEIAGGPDEEAEVNDLGFDDPFFTAAPDEKPEESKTKIRKEERRKRREAREAEEAAQRSERENLALLVPNEEENGRSFDMKELIKAEKKNGKKGKKSKKAPVQDKPAGDMELEVDDRFSGALGAGRKWAIDPTQPSYSATSVTKKLTAEMKKRRVDEEEGEDGEGLRVKKKAKKNKEKKKREEADASGDAEWQNLVAKVKMKSRRHGR
ncbi:hypothetical protein MKZ38_005464 [Zalerion maritima]|uniref:ESF1 RRM domain-containing protein n=1 Tax=Zalerion maritima TaxID=339359 RepID=A0AAD5WP96_9PEZI|nr:hypothetical protein MKZ38_005464 [Zalerion maritima]